MRETEVAPPMAEVIRRHGMTRYTHRWKSRFAGLDMSEARRLTQLEDENHRLKPIVADQAPSGQILRDVLGNE